MALKLKSRKGMLFTLLTLVLFMIMAAELITYVQLNYSYNNFILGSSQAQSSYYLINSIRSGSALVVREGLMNALNALAIYESTPSLRGSYFVSNTQGELQSLMLTGDVYNGVGYSNSVATYMGNSTILAYMNSLQAMAKQSNANLLVEGGSLNVFQSSPFSVSASYSALVHVSGSSGNFVYPLSVNVTVPLNGTLDLQAARIGIQKPFVGIQNFSPVTVVGDATAYRGSTSPFMLDIGTIINVPGTPMCANVPSQFQNGNYILATPYAMDIPQSVCGMGGLVTYQANGLAPIKPYLVYSSASDLIAYLQNGTSELISGSTLSLLNIGPLEGAVHNGSYVPQSGAASYLDGASGNFSRKSQYGVFSFLLPNVLSGSFDGSSSYISTGTAGLPTGSQAESVFAWIYYPASASSSNYYTITALGEGSGCSGSGCMFLQVRQGDIGISDQGTGYTGLGPLPVTPGEWQFVGYTVSAGENPTATIYHNGQSTTATIATLDIGQGIFDIGQTGFAPPDQQFFPGQIADVQVYGTALSASQVQALYQEGITSVPVQGGGAVGWWPLNGNAKDYSGNGNDGMAYNVIYAPISDYHANPAFLGSSYSYPVSTPMGFGCESLSNCNSSQLFLGKSNVWSTYYVPVAIINGQAAATPEPFQEMITFSPVKYSAYEADDLGNIRFYLGNTELYSWCESGCSAQSTDALFWVSLPNGIAGSSVVTVNMTFGPTVTDYDGVYAGEAPQLSSAYGQYDNGRNVFNLYDNFKGTSLNTTKWNSEGTVTVSNGISILYTGDNDDIISNAAFSAANVVDAYGELNTPQSSSQGGWIIGGVGFASGLLSGATPAITNGWAQSDINNFGLTIWDGSSYFYADSPATSQSTYTVFSTAFVSASSTTAYINYQQSASSSVSTSGGALNAVLGFQYNNFISNEYQWIRVRAYPPGGVMPFAIFGKVAPQSSIPQYSYGLDSNGFTFPGTVSFDGTSSLINVGTPATVRQDMPVAYPGSTYSAWVNLNGGVTSGAIAARTDADTGAGWIFSIADLKPFFEFVNSPATDDFGVSGAYGISAGTWNYVTAVVTYSGGTETVNFYINGAPAGSGLADGVTMRSDSADDMYIGASPVYSAGGNAVPFDGSISDLQIYNKALTAQQVAQLYLNNSVYGIVPAAYWPLDGPLGGSYNETQDVVGGNYGVLYGNPLNSAIPCTSAEVFNGACGTSYNP
jgi:hypothetical protein